VHDVLPNTHARIEEWRHYELGFHGLQLYVSLRGERIVDVGLGEARPGVEMRADTICRQHCTASPLTAFALAPFLAKGEIGLDQPVKHFLPDFGARGKDRITLRHVLTHTAGIHTCDDACLIHSEERILAVVCAARLPDGWAPGAQATYSNVAGWALLGGIVQQVAGVPLRTHLREALLRPLGMVDTWVGMSSEDYEALRDRLGVQYAQDANDSFEAWLGLPMTPLWHDLSREACTVALPSGGYGPSRDLGRFYEALLDRAKLEDIGLGDGIVVDQFVTAQRSGLYDSGFGQVCDYGFGFMVNVRQHGFGKYCSDRSYGHCGINGSSVAFADEEKGLVVALLPTDIFDARTCAYRRRAIVDAVYEDLDLV
jgi:CubicO group peptidase (beta-lactamase class C family)